MMTPLACATACGIGTGPAPINSSGSVGRMAVRAVVGGGAMDDGFMVSGTPDTATDPSSNQSVRGTGSGPDAWVDAVRTDRESSETLTRATDAPEDAHASGERTLDPLLDMSEVATGPSLRRIA